MVLCGVWLESGGGLVIALFWLIFGKQRINNTFGLTRGTIFIIIFTLLFSLYTHQQQSLYHKPTTFKTNSSNQSNTTSTMRCFVSLCTFTLYKYIIVQNIHHFSFNFLYSSFSVWTVPFFYVSWLLIQTYSCLILIRMTEVTFYFYKFGFYNI